MSCTFFFSHVFDFVYKINEPPCYTAERLPKLQGFKDYASPPTLGDMRHPLTTSSHARAD